jgi:hypothetical protein
MTRILFALLVALCPAANGIGADNANAKEAYMRGIQLETVKDYTGAIQAYEESLKADPDYAWAWRELGNCHFYLNERSEALDCYQQYLKVKPDDSKVAGLAKALQAQPAPAVAGAKEDLFKPGFGVRGLLGYGFGLSGNAISSNLQLGGSAPSTGYYSAFPGSGAAYGLEGLWNFQPNFEAGLAVFPLSMSSKGTSTYSYDTGVMGTAGITDETQADFFTLPIILELYGRVPLLGSKKFNLLAGAGIGYAAGGDIKIQSSESVASVLMPYTATSTQTRSVQGGLVYRGFLGGEYNIKGMFSVFLGLAGLSASLTYSGDSSHADYSYPGGQSVSYDITTTYLEGTPPVKPVSQSTTTTTSGSTQTVVQTSDTGVTQQTMTQTSQWNGVSWTLVKTTYRINYNVQKGPTFNISQMALLAGVTMRF